MGHARARTAMQIADGLAYVCEHVDQVRATLTRGPSGGLPRLDALLAALRNGEDPTAPLGELHRALLAAHDALGVFGRARDASMLTTPGIPADRPYVPVVLCPRTDHPCARFAWPEPGGTPVCKVVGDPLRHTTLTP